MQRSRTLRPLLARFKSTQRAAAVVNPPSNAHEPWAPPKLDEKDNNVDLNAVSSRHWDKRGAWSTAQLREAQDAHVMATWGPTNAIANLPMITNSEGAYLFDADGTRYLDWTSQAICANLGYTVPPAVLQSINEQLTTVPFVYGGVGMTDIRCRLAALLAECLPGDLDGFLFPSGGAEANEAAIRIARRYTGRQKILTQFRSYHGGTSSTIAATGDFRRHFDEGGSTGFIKAINPSPLLFAWDEDPELGIKRSLAALEEQILLEGSHTIAAVLLESITGSAGVFAAKPEYMRGVRALCDKYGIIYIADEVMVGFGRTGKMWGFQHYEGLLPDIVTSAKGLSASFIPLSMVAVRSHIMDHFRTNPLGWGATFQAHPVALACAYECIKHSLERDLVGHVKSLEPTMVEGVQRMIDDHPSVRGGRAVGLFGCVDLQTPDGAYIQPVSGPPHPAVPAFKAALLENGIYGFVRPPLFHCAPPLIVTESELRDGFERVNKALDVLDHEIGS